MAVNPVDVAVHTEQLGLLQAEPELARFLDAEERDEARDVHLPVIKLAPGPLDIAHTLRAHDAFGGLLVDGLLSERLLMSDHTGLRLLGPGDILSLRLQMRSMLLARDDYRVLAPARLVLLGREVQLAVRRWPALLAAMHARVAEQADRLAAQLVICQLPRVEERLLCMMWLLAEAWGHVTPHGTSLPLELRHEVLGTLVGARRPTVTLALGELAERGSLIRQDGRWLILEPPPTSTRDAPDLEAGVTLLESSLRWTEPPAPEPEQSSAGDALAQRVADLREQHLRMREELHSHLASLGESRRARQRSRTERRQRRDRAAVSGRNA